MHQGEALRCDAGKGQSASVDRSYDLQDAGRVFDFLPCQFGFMKVCMKKSNGANKAVDHACFLEKCTVGTRHGNSQKWRRFSVFCSMKVFD